MKQTASPSQLWVGGDNPGLQLDWRHAEARLQLGLLPFFLATTLSTNKVCVRQQNGLAALKIGLEVIGIVGPGTTPQTMSRQASRLSATPRLCCMDGRRIGWGRVMLGVLPFSVLG